MLNDIKAVVFDLDDTLYPERDYVSSGFRHVASYLEMKYSLHADEVYYLLMEDFDNGLRGRNFDVLIEKTGIMGSKEIVPELVKAYRSHNPKIDLPHESKQALSGLKRSGLLLGLVTDGYVEPQKNKVVSLGLEYYMDAIVYTDIWGKGFWKPHEKGFIEVCHLLNVDGGDSCYIADNPEKDFRGAKAHNMHTIQLRHWINRDLSKISEEYQPEIIVDNLEELLGLCCGEGDGKDSEGSV